MIRGVRDDTRVRDAAQYSTLLGWTITFEYPLYSFSSGVERCRSTVHNWVQKAELQPTGGVDPDHVALDETVIQLNVEQYWLYTAVDPDTNRLLHVRFYSTRTQALTEMFLSELREKHLVDDAIFLVDGAPWLQAACHRLGLRFQHVTRGNRNAVENAFRELKRRPH